MKLSGSTQISYPQVQNLIANHLNYVHFPGHIEKIYRHHYRQEAVKELRFRAPIIFVLYSFLTFGIYKVSLETPLDDAWLETYMWVGVINIMVWVFTLIPSLNRFFDWYTGAAAIAGVSLTFIMITHIGQIENNALFHVAMMYAIVIVYSFMGLRFYTALFAGWLGGLLPILFSQYFGYNIDWLILNRTYIFTSFLGMALSYAIDRQHRENFLQNCLIKLNQKKLLQQAELLESLSRHDALTGLANRRYLEEILTREWQTAQQEQTSLSIMMLDIDYFKNYNDSLGHVAGDNCLQCVANLLKQKLHHQHETAARYGGEEFMLVLPMTDLTQAEQIAQDLIAHVHALNLPHPNSDIAEIVTVSIGVVHIVPQQRHILSELIVQSDQALYHAKKYGRNRYASLQL